MFRHLAPTHLGGLALPGILLALVVALAFLGGRWLASGDPEPPPALVHAYTEIARAAENPALPWESFTPDQRAAFEVFPPSLQPAFYAVGCAETGLRIITGPPNPNGTIDEGPWQLNSPWFDGTAYPSIPAFPPSWATTWVGNAKGALIVFHQQGLDAWSTWDALGRTAASVLAAARSEGNCIL